MQELHQYIHRMDAAEKKYFRRFGLKDESKGDSQTKQLFELLDSITDYNEEKLHYRIKRLKLEKQINHTKSYLFHLLTETLVWYHRENFPELKNAFDNATVQLLSERGQEAAAEKALSKANKDIVNNGSFAERWSVLSNGIHTATNEFLSNKKRELTATNDSLELRGKLLDEMKRYHEYDVLLSQQLILIRKAMQARSKEELDALNSIMQNELVQSKAFATSHDSRFVFHTIRLQHFNIVGNLKDALEEAEHLITFLKTSPRQESSAMRKLWAYSQLTQACYFNGQWEKLELYLHELHNVPVHSLTESVARFSYYVQLAIPMLDRKKDTKALLSLLNEAKEQLKKSGSELRVDVRMGITITCASAFVEYKEYKQAIEVCEHFLTNYNTGIRLDIMLMLYVYEFIAHLETGNALYVSNTIQNVNRYFIRNNFKGLFENTLLKIFKKLSEAGDVGLSVSEIKDLKTELQKSADKDTNPQVLSLMPIVISFLDTKLK